MTGFWLTLGVFIAIMVAVSMIGHAFCRIYQAMTEFEDRHIR